MKIRTKDLTGAALDWAVAKADENLYPKGDVRLLDGKVFTIEPGNYEQSDRWQLYDPSTDWAQGGSIIDHMVHEGLRLTGYKSLPTDPTSCQAQIGNIVTGGPTPLIAAMRCYVTSKLGDEVEIPEKLLPAEL